MPGFGACCGSEGAHQLLAVVMVVVAASPVGWAVVPDAPATPTAPVVVLAAASVGFASPVVLPLHSPPPLDALHLLGRWHLYLFFRLQFPLWCFDLFPLLLEHLLFPAVAQGSLD